MKVLIVLSMLVLLAVPVQAQVNPCDKPVSEVALDPTRVFIKLADFTATIPGTSTFVFDRIVVGNFLEGVDPATGGKPVDETVLTRDEFLPVSGAPDCHVAVVGMGATPTAAKRSATRTRRTLDSAEGEWSPLGNPFVNRPAAPPRVEATRRGK